MDKREAHKARDLLRDAIESLSEGFALYDEDSRLVMFNKRYAEMNHSVADLLEPGLDWEVLMRETARRGIYTEALGREDQWVSERLHNGVQYIQDYELHHTDGTCYLVSVHPTELGGFVVTRTDITAKKQAEAFERDSDLLVRTVLDASSAVVVMARIGDGEILYRSPGALDLFGPTKNARQHYAFEVDRADYITNMLVDGQVDDYRLTFVNARGEMFPATVSGRIAEYKGEEALVSSIVDLTEQVKTEEMIRQILEACPVPIQMTNAETGKVLFTSPETTAMFGAVDSSHSYYPVPGSRRKYLDKLREKGWVNDYKVELSNGDGKSFWAAISSRLIKFKGEEVIVSNTRDLTDELAIQDELERQRQLLFQNEKMSALGELLAGVAHELNNPLSVVVGHSLMLREEAVEPEMIRRIEKVSSAAERCAKIVKTFLAMARQQPTRMEPTEINAVIATAIDVAGYGGQGSGIAIDCDLEEGLPDIVADADQLTQLVINLVINAEQAITKSGIGDRILVSSRRSSAGSDIEVFVEDNGPGIPDAIRARIFEPFFTTKEVGDGTGIGLAFCHRIIRSHGGQIWLDKDRALGSRFGMRLPVARANGKETLKTQPGPGNDDGARILVVDDEVEVAELAAEILKKDGFLVDLAQSGLEAVERLKRTRYRVVLSDFNMPDMDGAALYDAIARDFPDLLNRTGFITGDTMGRASQSLLKMSNRPYLEKPVSPSELRQLVYTILNDTEDDA